MGESQRLFYLLDVGDHECGHELYVVSGRQIDFDDVRKLIFERPKFFEGDKELVRGHSNRTLEEAVSVRFGLGGTFSDSWVYAVTVYEGGVIRDDEIDVIEKFTGKEIIEIE